ncbi:class I SAM-dependent methyltransferase [Streptomyces rochei]
MRKTTAPAGGPVAARPGPQDAAESANGVIPGAGPVGPVTPLPTDPPGGGEPELRHGGLAAAPGGTAPAPSAGTAGRTDLPAAWAAWAAGQPGAGRLTDHPAADHLAHPAADHSARPAAHPPGPAADRDTIRLRETAGTATPLTGTARPFTGSAEQPAAEASESAAEPPTTAAGTGATPDHPDDPPRYAPEWLRLREPADAAARAHDLLDPLRVRLADRPGRAAHDGLVVHDLGCGTGSMGRWLAPLLDGAQHWVLHDRDPYLLHFAAVGTPRTAADGSRVTVETRRGDLARLTPDALTGAGLVTASALLDVLTAREVGALAAACAAAGCPALLTLSVAGRVELTPEHPLDTEITLAFNDHQRRSGLLGPDAVSTAAEAFAAHGATVRTRSAPWRLGPDEAALAGQWLRGWVAAAVEQRPELREPAARYVEERLAACVAGELRVVVHHTDLLALCRPKGAAS